MDRRRFLAVLAAGAGTVALAGCSSSGGTDAGGSEGGSSEGRTASTTTGPVPGAVGIDADPFTLGVASGDPLPSSVILWTRLLGGPADADQRVRWEVAEDEGFDRVVRSGVAPAPAALGQSVHVDADELEPDTWYWYRFRVGDFTSPVGRTRTTPDVDASVDELTICFASCQLRTAGHWTAYPHLVEDQPDLVFFLGDYIYEYPGGEGALRVPLDEEPATLDDFRTLYAAYQADAGLQAAQAAAPWVVTWDDHEVENNYAADVPEKPEDEGGFDQRRRAAYQAFYEHHPLRVDPPAAEGSLAVYRSVRYGDLAEFFVLDGRQHRTDQPCNGDIAVNIDTCDDIDDPEGSMLGSDQESWLMQGLTETEVTWPVLAQQTVMKSLMLGSIVLNVDQWDGYPAARTRLLEGIDAAGVENVMVLTGDIHASGAADLTLPDAGPDGKVVAHELVGTSISSPGIGALASGLDLTPLGLPYANFSDHGYVRCTITPERWTADFVMVDTIEEETSEARVDATVDVVAGTPGVQLR